MFVVIFIIVLVFLFVLGLLLKLFKKTNKLLYIFLFLLGIFFIYVGVNLRILVFTFAEHGFGINKIEINDFINDEVSISINLKKTYNNKTIYCAVSKEQLSNFSNVKWVKSKNNVCKIKASNKIRYIYLKDKNNLSASFIISEYLNQDYYLGLSDSKVYLRPKEKYEIDADLKSIGNSSKLSYESSNNDVAIVEDGVITAKKVGTATIKVSSKSITKNINVVVTKIINKLGINNDRPFLKCNRYTKKEEELLEEILKYKVDKAGRKTRAGVVAAIWFLSQEFPYKIPYFLENGRLTMEERYADGEGRFYHNGLYLTEKKYSLLKKYRTGPKPWGCALYEYDSKRYRPNGLDCSGFVTWAILNGGFDVGDHGAMGFNDYDHSDDISFVAERVLITKELMESKKIKAGDLANQPGHAAIVAGIDYDKEIIYIAEELRYSQGLVVLSLSFDEIVNHKNFTYITLMDDYYKEDGNYKAVWYKK